MRIQNAQKHHARDLAYLINLAGEGMAAYLWQYMAEGDETVMDVGTRRASREQGGFSYTHARVCLTDDKLAGMLLGYRQPDPYDVGDLLDYPDIVRPLIELESLAPGSWYINALATYSDYQGQGVATKLLQDAGRRARSSGCDALTLITASENTRAKSLYRYLGFCEVDCRDVIKVPGLTQEGEWLLMFREV